MTVVDALTMCHIHSSRPSPSQAAAKHVTWQSPIRCFFQGGTLVVPPRVKDDEGFSPCHDQKDEQGLKPRSAYAFTARLKSCPDTKQRHPSCSHWVPGQTLAGLSLHMKLSQFACIALWRSGRVLSFTVAE
jgi:hypothetical protein